MIRTSKEKWLDPNKGLQAALAYDAKRAEELSEEFHEPVRGTTEKDTLDRMRISAVSENDNSDKRQAELIEAVKKEIKEQERKLNKWNKERGSMSVEEFVEESNRLANIDLT